MAPRTVAIHSPATPERDSARQAPAITATQKQALIDNLQLESKSMSNAYGAPFLTRLAVTERARKLRAQYALHAQGLRSRLEMRINRVPKQLRATNIADLIDQYSEQLEPPSKKPLPVTQSAIVSSKAALNSRTQLIHPSSPARSRGMKRQSSDMAGGSDKENDIDMPKKRTKTTTAGSSQAGPVRASRTTSRKVDPSKVLSPKSHNSRQLPQSPFKQPTSPGKSYLARPISPVKPGTVAAATASLASLVAPAEKPRLVGRAATKQLTIPPTGSLRGRRPVAATTMAPPPVPPKTSRGRAASSSSDTSTGTTVVKTKKTTAKKGVIGKMTNGIATAAGKRAAAPKKENIPVPSASGAGGRVLRARR